MRKFLEKFGLLMQVVVSSIFVLFMFLLLVGALEKADFHNNVVYILFGTLIALHVVFSSVMLYLQYSADLLSSVTVYSDNNSSTKASVAVIKDIVKKSTKDEAGVKVNGIKVFIDEKGLLMSLRIKLKNRLPEETIEILRENINAAFLAKLNIKFYFINFHVTSLKHDENEMPIKEHTTDAPKNSEEFKFTEDTSNIAVKEEQVAKNLTGNLNPSFEDNDIIAEEAIELKKIKNESVSEYKFEQVDEVLGSTEKEKIEDDENINE